MLVLTNSGARRFQAKVSGFINANHGSAVALPPVSNRWAWNPIHSEFASVLRGGPSLHDEEAGGWPDDADLISEARGDPNVNLYIPRSCSAS